MASDMALCALLLAGAPASADPSIVRRDEARAGGQPVAHAPGSDSAGADPDAVRGLVAEMMADAQTRTSLLADASPAGHNGKNFFLQSADGRFKLVVRGQVQFRYYLNFRDRNDHNNDGRSEDDFESGFQTRRTKVFFEGHVWDPALTYRVNGTFSRSTGDFLLEDAWASYKWENGVSILWGQFKPPFLREEYLSSTTQLAVERTFVNDTFTIGRTQGVQIGWQADEFKATAAFTDGAGATNSEFFSARRTTASGLLNRSGQGESDYALTGRVEWKPAGKWSQFSDFTSPAGSEFALMLGAAGHVEGGDGSSSAFSGGTYVYASWTADLSVEGDGWNLYAAAVGGHSDFHDTAAGDVSNDDYGFFVQGGFMIPDTQLEPFARHEVLFADPDRTGAEGYDAYNALTVGCNWYLYGHAAKFTVDTVWRMNEADPFATGRSAFGILGDDNPGEVVVRIQWQLLF